MLRPESPLADHRSLLPRRLLPAKAQIAPADKRKNRRSLELAPERTIDYPKLLISKTTDSLQPKSVPKNGSVNILEEEEFTHDRRAGCAKPTLAPVAEKSDGAALRWGSDLLSPRREPRMRAARSWYGYGTLPAEPDKVLYTFF